MTAVDLSSLSDAQVVQEFEKLEASEDPKALIRFMTAKDQRRVALTLNPDFTFNMDDPEAPWGWQMGVVDAIREHQTTLILKARQLGATWLGCCYGAWLCLYRPGSLSLFYRQKEEDAKKLVDRAAILMRSLPGHLKNGAKLRVAKTHIECTFPDGNVSRILAQSSADASGMGETAAFILLDEYAWIENASAIMKSVSSAAGQEGRILIVSTANGTYNKQTGEGNYFAYLWDDKEANIHKIFLPWSYHPDRDENWKKTADEYLRLREWERKEQYPATAEEAFELTDACWFDRESLYWYAHNAIQDPLYSCDFQLSKVGKARLVKDGRGMLSVYEEPKEDGRYAIGADVAQGTGLDFSSAFVADLDSMSLVAEFHGKLDTDQYAEQLHYLGRWYNTALLAVEDAGGFGNAVTISLRDGRQGRPPYPRQYMHRQFVRPDQKEHAKYGFPMTTATRAPVLEHLEEAIRERSLPFLTSGLYGEMRSFVRYDPRTGQKPSGTWPRAMNGANDDRVMAAAITLEMFRQRGNQPLRPKRKPKPYQPAYPWSN